MTRLRPSSHWLLITLLLVFCFALLSQHFSSAKSASVEKELIASGRLPTTTTQQAQPIVPAATITVDSAADGPPANDGHCTLREAIINANANNQSGSTDCAAGSGTDTIGFSALFNSAQTITLTNGEILISQGVTINGPGANLLTVSGNNVSRIFRVGSGVTGVSISGMTITKGKAGDVGGGIVSDGDLTLTNCAFTNNSASGQTGGGVYEAGGTGTFTGCTFNGNSAGLGAGIQVINASATITDCTVSGNNGTISGAGINFTTVSGGASKTLAIRNSTIANNTSPATGGLLITSVSGVTATATMVSSIIANNTTANVATAGGGTATFTSQGFNLSDNWNGLATLSTDKTGPPLLGSLASNGGTTQTLALLGGSPAIDAGSNPLSLTTDQRNLPRSSGAGVDIGAFEVQAITVTNAHDNGPGSLRDAIANAASTSEILFDPTFFNVPRTITLTTGELVVPTNLIINGPGANLLTVSGNNASRVFSIGTGSGLLTNPTVSLSGMTITGGNGAGAFDNGLGGGIYNFAFLTVSNSTISGNTASQGGGIYNFKTMTVNNSTIPGNTAGNGGGVFNHGSLTVTGSTISGNTANASGTGGGIDDPSDNDLTITNSTISGNRAPNGDINGGGIRTGLAHITNSTITNNSVAGANSASGIKGINGAGVSIGNSIIAANVNNGAQPDVALTAVNGSFISNGFNLIGNPGSVSFNSTGDQKGTSANPLNPLLGPLALNGGTTQTHALLGGSPALDQGNSSGSPTDQRGLPRPFDISNIAAATGGDNSDIGAFEAQAIIVTNANNTGVGSLRDAIANSPTNSDILFDPTFFNVARTITLTSGELVIPTNLTINGPSANLLTISGNNQSRVFSISTGFTVTLSGMTITGGNGTGALNSGFGGGIFNVGTLTVNNMSISGNNASQGGGILNGGVLTVDASTISGNTSTAIGQTGGGIDDGHILKVINSTISGNHAPNGDVNGGGIRTVFATITNCTITNNSAGGSNSASGILNNGSVTIQNSIVAANINNVAQPDVTASIVAQSLTSNGFNLIGNVGTTVFSGPGDLKGTGANPLNPSLGPLALNGGTTFTHALLFGSPALDAGNNSGSRVTFDQRGSQRTFDLAGVANASGSDGTDIGAYEAQTTPAPAPSVLSIVRQSTNPTTPGANVNYTVTFSTSVTGVDTSDFVLTTTGLTGASITSVVSTGASRVVSVNTGSGNGTLRLDLVDDDSIVDGNNVPLGGIGAGNGGFTTGEVYNVNAPPATHLSVSAPANAISGTAFNFTVTALDASNNTVPGYIGTVHFTKTDVVAGSSVPADYTFTAADSGAHTFSATLTTTGNQTITATDTANSSITGTSGSIAVATSQIIVTTTADEQNTNGQCSLREAIINANKNNQSGSTDCAPGSSGSTDVISFSPLFNTQRTITLTLGELSITGDTSIGAPGANLLTISGNNQSRVFDITGGPVLISGMTITGGNGVGASNNGLGGGIVSGHKLTLTNVNVTGNQSVGGGGGVGLALADGVFTGCTFNGNAATDTGAAGGAIFYQGNGGHTLKIVNSTISGNSAPFGGGITNLSSNSANDSRLELINSTIVNNNSGILTFTQNNAASTATTTLRNTIIANSSNNLTIGTVNGGAATIISQGNNLANDTGGGFLNQSTDLLNSNPLIAPLALNGGTTPTHALLLGSPALDAGNNSGLGVTFDQRGSTRNVDLAGVANAPGSDGTDIGAYEAQTTPAPAPSVSSIARASANPTTPGATVNYTVTFSTSVTGVDAGDFTLTTSGLTGASVTGVTGSGTSRTVSVNAGSGTGTLRLDLTDDDTIIDASGVPLGGIGAGNGGFTTGEVYNVNQPPTVLQFSAPLYVVGEGDQRVTLTVTRSGDSSAAASAGFTTSDNAGSQACNVFNGQASARCDYLISIGSVQFAAGETSKTFSIPIVDDSYAEGNENFFVTLNNVSGATLGSQSTTTVMIVDNDTTTGPNPVDQSAFYVRQHYLDFLNREPDTSGLNFWINNIDSCGADQNCLAVKRVDTSAAFFLSIEFQQTGYLVERIYKASYGDATAASTFPSAHQLSVPIVRLGEFLPDTQEIGRGVVVGQGNWQQQLEDNKNAFTLEFVQRSRFTTAFATSMTPAQFVDKLFQNAGVTPATSDRTVAVNEFGAATTTGDMAARARALRDVAENATLNQQEFNRAFVLMQFFGYLRRNPNDVPDADYTGYDFWLTKLNQFNGDYNAAEMVKAFILSGEYRQRFGL